MASFFNSFRSSNMPKRLLRYALSRLELLDTEALDIDKLDFTLGMNTVFTFQDVGIKLQKLERLLNLPPSFEIQKAKVLLLRITIPSAIYTSPIIVEVDGVQVKLRVAPKEGSKDDHGGPQKTKRSRNAEEEEVVPHAIDLAQSFLETQPSNEKAELQAALQAETQDLGASVASTEDGSEEDFPLGTGQPLSLPAFLADFLQGVVDRTQVSIKGVTFQLDVEALVEPGSTVPELVTFQLAIDDINVEGVTTEVQEPERESSPKIVHKEGKRHIALSKIRASLISEANVFSTLARTPSKPSTAATNSPVMMSRQNLLRDATSVSMPSLHQNLSKSAELEQSRLHHPLIDSEDAFDIPYDIDSSNGDPENAEPRSTPSTPRALSHQIASSSLPQTIPLRDPAQSAIHPPGELWASVERSVRSEPAIKMPHEESQALHNSELINESPPEPLSGSNGPTPTPLPDEDLERSRMFSHEDAESMYMSAFSDTSPSQGHRGMPGAWNSEPFSAGGSPKANRISSGPALSEAITSRYSGGFPATTHEAQRQADGVHPEEFPSEERLAEDLPVDNLEEAMHHHGDSTSQIEHSTENDTATPKGPTRLVKELVSLAAISLYVPSNHEHIQAPLSRDTTTAPRTPTSPRSALSQSTAPNIPGAFSVYAGAQSTDSIAQTPSILLPKDPADNVFEVVLAPLDVRCDVSTGFLLAMVISKILSAFKDQRDKPVISPKKQDSQAKPSALPDIKIAFEQISVHFLETLAGIADTPERLFNPSPVLDADALLTAKLDNLTLSISKSQDSVVTSVDLGKFNFGYGNDDIISFDQRLQMRASVRDAFPSAGADVAVKVTQTSDATRCEIKTLPLHVKLDLLRLDETFSWFGGLSGFLNMSSSMSSNAPSSPKSPTKTTRKSRGVRFDAPIRPDDASVSSDNKVNMRLGGFHLDLIGKECLVSLDTSAVKLVSREEGLGIGISKIHLTGPVIRRSMGDPPISAVIANTRIEYLVSPKDKDLERLLELIIPSKYKFDEGDDEIMVDTLLRQRRKGAVLRLNVDDVDVKVGKLPELEVLPALGEEIARLSTVAKYLPEDDRPGFLTLTLVRNVDIAVDVGGKMGMLQTSLKDVEVGHISIPSLIALGIGTITMQRNLNEVLVGSDVSSPDRTGYGPVLTMRMIPDEMDPVIKLRLRHLSIEYRVHTIMDILDLAEDITPQEFEANLAASVANLGEQAHAAITGRDQAALGGSSKGKSKEGKPTKVNVAIRDCLLGLNPLGLSSKMVIALTDAHLEIDLFNGGDTKALGHLNKASVLLIDDVATLDSKEGRNSRRRSSSTSTPQVTELCQRGYVDICYISSARATVTVSGGQDEGEKSVDIEVQDDLLVLETCADSMQTLITLANALTPPTPPSKEIKYRIAPDVPLQDLLSSISADAFGQAEGDYDFDNDFGFAQEFGGEGDESLDFAASSQSSPLHVDSQYYEEHANEQLEASVRSMSSEKPTVEDTNDGVLLTNFSSQGEMDDEELVIKENYSFGANSAAGGSARRWNSAKNEYEQDGTSKTERYPFTIRVRDVHAIWNLFDGYDWNHTREVISKAVHDIETTAIERQSRQDRARSNTDMEFVEEETVIGDFLFNSIYIGIPANRDPRELALAINQDLNDNATETESLATTALTATPSRQGGAYRTKKKLKLNRSKRHKITFELKGVNVDLVAYPPGSGETQSFVDIRVKDLDIFDHVPTSTWKKFATYDQDAGEREMGSSMVHLNIWNVKPVPQLAASEIVLRAAFLPLRLHVDQDALDFITRFFEFKDDSAPPTHASPSDVPFIQRAEVDSIPVKLDFKPKRVDYAGLRSGHTTEFMNFIVLDEARMVLRHTIIYGVSGFDRLGKTLNDIWMPDVKRNQLPGILAGLAPVRSIVNVGSGFKDLIEIPIKEYKKDGRIVRSIGKGAAAFAKTTGTEIVKLGAKLAVGTQYALQGAEGMLVEQPESREQTGWDDEDLDDEETKQISLYADQPTGVVQGLKGAYSSLARDLNVARDAIIAVPGAVMESQNAQGAAKAVLKRAPTIIFRPLIGSSKAIGQTLMGATNSLDPQNRRRADEKYKRH
ncbi:hypothetical protein DL769_007857 [Monosporascus sp. CRB-8-3]|nr:hypothetical protein DL769_007857 [Monosporascus sp. CRB-8-3]